MSLKYRDVTGKETPIAGLNGLSGELVPSVSYYQTGVATITETIPANSYKAVDVTFANAMPDKDYCVVFAQHTRANTHSDAWGQTAEGFRVYMYNDTDEDMVPSDARLITVTWRAFKLMTDESRAIDEAAIATNTADIATLKTFGEKVLWTGRVTRGGTISFDSTGYDELYAICGGAKLRCVSISRGKNVRYKFVGQWNGRDAVQEGALVGYYKQDYILDILANGTVATCGWFTTLGTTADDNTYHGQYVNENNINCTQIIGVKYPSIG